MRIAGSGASVDVQIAGYQFPVVDKDPKERTGWDANWLIITGLVRTDHSPGAADRLRTTRFRS